MITHAQKAKLIESIAYAKGYFLSDAEGDDAMDGAKKAIQGLDEALDTIINLEGEGDAQ